MSLKRNVLANYLGQAYVALIGIVMVPVYVRYMGAEAYGLVGFFTMLQAWFQLLDLGLTPTISRELSRYKAGALSGREVSVIVRSMEWFFLFLGTGCALVVALASTWIAREWLVAKHLTQDELLLCILCMGGMMAPRWLVGLYRSGLSGLERMTVLNYAGALLATARALGVMAVLLFWTSKPSGFFLYQLILALVELILMRVLFYKGFPMREADFWSGFRPLRRILGLAGSMAFLAGLWIVISQTDRLVLSWVLDLHSYGYFVVAVTLAGGITLLAGPLGVALQPRFAVLAAQGEHVQLVKLYRVSTQMTVAGVFAIAGVLAGFARPIILAWTGDAEVADEAARLVPLYGIGNALVAVLSVAFLLQFALGKLRWHLAGNCLFSLVWLPGAYYAARYAGAVGAGWVWLGANLAYLVCWLPYVHRRLLPFLWWRWLVYDVLWIVLVQSAVLALVWRFDWTTMSRFGVIAAAVTTSSLLMIAGLLAGGETRGAILQMGREIFSPARVKG